MHFQNSLRWYTLLFDVLAFGFTILIFATPLFDAVKKQQAPALLPILGPVVYALVIGILFLFMGNLITDIVSDEDGLHIHFLLDRFDIPWADIIEAKPLFKNENLRNFQILRVRSLTPLHRLYGFVFTLKATPTLLYTGNLNSYDELNRRIRAALKENRQAVTR